MPKVLAGAIPSNIKQEDLVSFDSEDIIVMLGTLGVSHVQVLHEGPRCIYLFRKKDVEPHYEALIDSTKPLMIDVHREIAVRAAFKRTTLLAKSK